MSSDQIALLSGLGIVIASFVNSILNGRKITESVQASRNAENIAASAREAGVEHLKEIHENVDEIKKEVNGRCRELIEAAKNLAFVEGLKAGENKSKQDRTKWWLAAVVQNAQEVFVGKNLHGIIISWNPAAEKFFGYSANDIIGRPVTVLFPKFPEMRHEEIRFYDEENMIMEKIKAGESIDSLVTKRMKRNGDIVDVVITVSPVRDENGKIIGASKILRPCENPE